MLASPIDHRSIALLYRWVARLTTPTHLLGLIAATLLTACGSPPAAGFACIDGATLPCSCAEGGKGAQTCVAGVYEACVCAPGQDAVADSGHDTSRDDTSSQADAVHNNDTKADTGSDASLPPNACISDKDCKPTGAVCDPLVKQCAVCLTDAHCGPSQHCIANVCQIYTACSSAVGCKSAKAPDGSPQPLCDLSNGECTACLTSLDCPPDHDCRDKACVPYAGCLASADCDEGQVCAELLGRCLDCLSNSNCNSGHWCEQGACVPFVACTSDVQCGGTTPLCDPIRGKCAQCVDNTDCPSVYHCQRSAVDQTGRCVLDVCTQGQTACSNNAKVTCNAAGDWFGAPELCPAKTTCVAQSGQPVCLPWVCTPGLSCDGNQLLTCSSDGLVAIGATDCGGSAKCVVGKCEPIVCEAGNVWCKDQTPVTCSKDGLKELQGKPCAAGTYCDAGLCKPQVCKPGTLACDGNVVQTCDANGAGYGSPLQDCGADAKCVAGKCEPIVCEAGKVWCEGQTPIGCSLDGLLVIEGQPCASGTYCDAGLCKPQVCKPGALACDGNVVQACDAIGAGYGNPLQDCGATAKCVAGKCEPIVCEAGKVWCEGQTPIGCTLDGLLVIEGQPCASGTYCTPGGCLQQVCKPGTQTCDGNMPATCNGDGSGYVDTKQPCEEGTQCFAGMCLTDLCGNGVCDAEEWSQSCPQDCAGLAIRLAGQCTSPGDMENCPTGFYCVARSQAGGGPVCVADFPTWVPIPDAHSASDFSEAADYVTDTLTGLSWAKEPLAPQPWASALTACTTQTYGGFVDWRLPTPAELLSLTDKTKIEPASSAPNVNWANGDWTYWTTISSFQSSALAWSASFRFGTSSNGEQKLTDARVRCVRSPATIAAKSGERFSAKDGGKIIHDRITGLRWQKGYADQMMNWADAKTWCSNNTTGLSGTGWRLPTIDELGSLVASWQYGPAIDAVFGATSDAFWSATPWTSGKTAWIVYFGGGGRGGSGTTVLNRVRCVR